MNELQPEKGTLYLCATPIGNLEDITARVLRILQEVDVVAAEDTRQTIKLFNRYGIHTPLVSYHQYNQKNRGKQLLQQMLEGKNVALVSDAGLPGISDPGEDLVRLSVAADIVVVPLPGPSASLTALIASGLPTNRFVFEGFLPLKGILRNQRLEDLRWEKRTMILYESPHRIKHTLADLLKVLGDRPAVLARELTKKFEEFQRGTLSEILNWSERVQVRGELTLIIAGTQEKTPLQVVATEQYTLPEEEVGKKDYDFI